MYKTRVFNAAIFIQNRKLNKPSILVYRTKTGYANPNVAWEKVVVEDRGSGGGQGLVCSFMVKFLFPQSVMKKTYHACGNQSKATRVVITIA